MSSSKPWRTEAVILFCAAQCLCFFAGAIAISILHRFHVHGFVADDDFGNILAGTLCFQGATWVLIPVFLKLHGVNWRDAFGFHKRNFLRSLALAAIVLIVVLPLALWLQHLSQLLFEKLGWHFEEEEAVTLIAGPNALPMKIYLGLFAIVIAPVAEEFIFRGVLYPFIKQRGFPKIALIGTSALFALIHGNAAVFIPLFVLALAFAWLYDKTDNLLAPVVAHGLFNSVNLVILSLQP